MKKNSSINYQGVFNKVLAKYDLASTANNIEIRKIHF